MNKQKHPFIQSFKRGWKTYLEYTIELTEIVDEGDGIGLTYYFNVGDQNVKIKVFKISEPKNEGKKTEYKSYPFKTSYGCTCTAQSLYPKSGIMCKHMRAVDLWLSLQNVKIKTT